VVAQCGYLRHCVEDAATLSEPEWHAALTVVSRCVEGEAIAHAISAPYPGYSPTETATKHAYAAGRDNPTSTATAAAARGVPPARIAGASPARCSWATRRATDSRGRRGQGERGTDDEHQRGYRHGLHRP